MLDILCNKRSVRHGPCLQGVKTVGLAWAGGSQSVFLVPATAESTGNTPEVLGPQKPGDEAQHLF